MFELDVGHPAQHLTFHFPGEAADNDGNIRIGILAEIATSPGAIKHHLDQAVADDFLQTIFQIDKNLFHFGGLFGGQVFKISVFAGGYHQIVFTVFYFVI